MEKMIEMCKILNCALEDLLDDGSVKETNPNNKINFSNYLNDFLKFITKIYNMFCAMKLKDIIKCLLEMGFIFFVLWGIGMILYAVLDTFLFNLLLNIPLIGYYLNIFFENIFTMILVIVGAIILFHLFKIRYLDYYVTIEDQTSSEKVLEESLSDNDNISSKQNKTKIIIRDPKHSKASFFDFLAKIIIIIIKFMFVMIFISVMIGFVSLIVGVFMSLYHIKYGIIFVFMALALLGLLILNYVFIELIFNFIISKKQNFKKIFIMIITSAVLFGAGVGLSFCIYSGFSKTDVLPKEFDKNNEISIPMKDNLTFNSQHITYKIDNSEKNIKLATDNKLQSICYYDLSSTNKYKVLDVYFCENDSNWYKLIYDDIKKKQTRDYDKIYSFEISASVSRENYNKLMKNYDGYIDYYSNYEEE